MDAPRLTVFSTPLVSTWVLDETHRILFDAGDGTSALLEGKIHKAHLIALTHSHRDHISGLPQLLNLRGGVAAAESHPLTVLHPDGSGAFGAMGRFLSHFDRSTSGLCTWTPWRAGNQLELADGLFLRSYATRHVPGGDPNRTRSLGYQIGRTVHRLKPDLRTLPQAELDRIRLEQGREAITTIEEEIVLTVTGDTGPQSPQEIGRPRFLLHECTFLDSDAERCAGAREQGHEHCCVSEVLDLAVAAGVERLALYHVSARYTDEEILRSVRAACAERSVTMQVSVALPGRLYIDLFSQNLWPGKG